MALNWYGFRHQSGYDYNFFRLLNLFLMQRTKTPDLVPEDADPIWIKSVQSITSPSAVKQRFHGIVTRISDHIGDPRIGPILLLGALMTFGTIWLRRSQPALQSNPPSQPNSGVSMVILYHITAWFDWMVCGAEKDVSGSMVSVIYRCKQKSAK